jgi:hypothetical protein
MASNTWTHHQKLFWWNYNSKWSKIIKSQWLKQEEYCAKNQTVKDLATRKSIYRKKHPNLQTMNLVQGFDIMRRELLAQDCLESKFTCSKVQIQFLPKI